MAYTKTTWVPGGPPGISSTALNNIENALESMIGKDNTSIVETTSLKLETDTRTVQLTYTAGVLTKVEDKNGSTVIKTTNLIYSSGVLTSVTEIANGRTVTTTLNYVSGTLDNVTKGVV